MLSQKKVALWSTPDVHNIWRTQHFTHIGFVVSAMQSQSLALFLLPPDLISVALTLNRRGQQILYLLHLGCKTPVSSVIPLCFGTLAKNFRWLLDPDCGPGLWLWSTKRFRCWSELRCAPRKREVETGKVSDPNGWIHWKYISRVAAQGSDPGVWDETQKGTQQGHWAKFVYVFFWLLFICVMICGILYCWNQTLPESEVTAVLPNGVELNDPQELIFEFPHLVVQSHNLQWMLRRLGGDGKVICLLLSVSLDAGAIIGIGKPIVTCASLAFTQMFAGKLLGGIALSLWVCLWVWACLTPRWSNILPCHVLSSTS